MNIRSLVSAFSFVAYLEYVKSVNNKRITLTNDTQFTLKRNYNSFVDAYHNNYMKRFKQ